MLTAVLIPVMIVAAFGGTHYLAHAHDGHALHLHAASSIEGARLSGQQHRHEHATGVATCGDLHAGHHEDSEPDDVPADCKEGTDFLALIQEQSGLIVSIPDHEQFASRAFEFPHFIHDPWLIDDAIVWLWTQPDVSEEKGSPGGRIIGGPLHLSARTASERLVWTSNALLI